MAALSAGSLTATGSSLPSLVAGCDEGELVDLVISEGLCSPAGQKLGHLLSPAQRSRLIGVSREEALRHLSYIELLNRFAPALEEANLTWVVLKGPVLTEVVYGDLPRGYADLDLMVPPRQLREAVRALEAVGAEFAEQDWPWMIKAAKGELSMAMFGRPIIDLHWHPVFHRRIRERFLLSTEDLLGRRRRVRLGAVSAWTLDQTDFAVHVALHASLAGAQRLRRLLDIERTVANEPPDWDLLVQRCREWRVALPVCAMLNCARQVLGAAVPEGVVAELASAPLQRLLVRGLGVWLPQGRLPGGRSIRIGLSRSLGDSSLATADAFLGETLQALADIFLPTTVARTDSDRFHRHNHLGRGAATSESSRPAWFDRYMDTVLSLDRWGRPYVRRHFRLFPLDDLLVSGHTGSSS